MFKSQIGTTGKLIGRKGGGGGKERRVEDDMVGILVKAKDGANPKCKEAKKLWAGRTLTTTREL